MEMHGAHQDTGAGPPSAQIIKGGSDCQELSLCYRGSPPMKVVSVCVKEGDVLGDGSVVVVLELLKPDDS